MYQEKASPIAIPVYDTKPRKVSIMSEKSHAIAPRICVALMDYRNGKQTEETFFFSSFPSAQKKYNTLFNKCISLLRGDFKVTQCNTYKVIYTHDGDHIFCVSIGLVI